MNDEIAQGVQFSIYPRHLEFLNKINQDSRSKALQTVLDSIINGEEQTRRKRILDNSLMFMCFGAFFLLFSYMLLNPYATIISIGIGVFVFTYGSIGGMRLALQRTKYR